ncbi:MAG: hypothetical protein ACLFV7_10645 [Phycisphaerae bacterium]
MTSPLNENERRDRDICRYLDGQMTPEQRAAFEREMLRDPGLHREMQRFEETDRHVGDALNALLGDRQVPKVSQRPAAGKPSVLVPTAAAIAAILLAVVGYFAILYTGQPHHGEDPVAVKSDDPTERNHSDDSTPTTSGDAATAERGRAAASGYAAGVPVETAAFFACEDTPVRVVSGSERDAGYAPDPPQPCKPVSDVPAETHVVTRRVFEVTDEETGEEYLIQLDEVNCRLSMTATDL